MTINSAHRNLSPRRATAVAAGKLTGVASKISRRGGGTALPGLVAMWLDPGIVRDLARQLPCGSAVVSGTNGKTTTSRMLTGILRGGGYYPLRNESGSNLMRGLASALIRHTGVAGNLIPSTNMLGIFEVDEAALPEVLLAVCPETILLLNLFRDQLDRYGEVATVARIWSSALRRLPTSSRVVVNADDPLVTDVSSSSPSPPIFFGMDFVASNLTTPEHASDVKSCPRCGASIEYSRVTLGHMGDYACSRCSFRRPIPSIRAANIELAGFTGGQFDLVTRDGAVRVKIQLPGLYNIYNALSAAACAISLGVPLQNVAESLERATPAFGRMERLHVDGREVVLALAKNPAGLNEVLRTLIAGDDSLHLLVMLNDNIADGRDVSWIWDADVEILHGRVVSIVFSGERAEDMALRFKYAELLPCDGNPQWSINSDPEAALRDALAYTTEGDYLFVIPTYTALLDVRNAMSRLAYAKPYWEE